MTPEITGLSATPVKGAVKLTWGVSNTNYLTGFEIVVSRSGEVIERLPLLPPSTRELSVTASGTGLKWNVRCNVQVGGKSIACDPLPAELTPPPPPTPTPSSLWLGICGLSDHGQAQAKVAVAATHARHDRIDVEGSLNARVHEEVAAGRPPLILMNNFDTTSVTTVCREMQGSGLVFAEFGNEIYYHNGYNPYTYAAEYKAAHAIAATFGVKLGANLYGDGTSGSVEKGHGWGKAFVETAGLPDFWTYHPYGGIAEDRVGEAGGWLSVPRMLELMKAQSWAAPLWVTEVGFPVWKGTDNRPAVTEKQQAEYVVTMIADAAKWGLGAFFWFGCQDSTPPGGRSEGGYGLYSSTLQARPAAAAYGSAVLALGKEA